jgi:hypothetical protein
VFKLYFRCQLSGFLNLLVLLSCLFITFLLFIWSYLFLHVRSRVCTEFYAPDIHNEVLDFVMELISLFSDYGFSFVHLACGQITV